MAPTRCELGYSLRLTTSATATAYVYAMTSAVHVAGFCTDVSMAVQPFLWINTGENNLDMGPFQTAFVFHYAGC